VPYRKEGAVPRKTIKITGEERDALYDQVRNHLAALGDVFVAMECQKDYPPPNASASSSAKTSGSSKTSAGRRTTAATASS
jgi:hypothetical protein